eukprot:JP447565.1.p1 GENE.JP447565.1~~JP447565.1.p1  ORF type:complete len:91 (+),score=18.92 JP447565.1:16-288(+)
MSLMSFYDFPLFDHRMQEMENASQRPRSSLSLSAWTPRCNVSETPTHLLVKAELPGVPKEKVAIDLEDNVLTISGEHSEEKVKMGRSSIT